VSSVVDNNLTSMLKIIINFKVKIEIQSHDLNLINIIHVHFRIDQNRFTIGVCNLTIAASLNKQT